MMIDQATQEAVLTPESEEALATMVSEANAPLSIRGGGTRGATVAGQPINTSSLTGVTLYEPGALTVVAQSGTPLAEVEATLAAEHQILPFEPTDLRALLGTEGESTIGGVVATGASGPRRVQAGACRDSLIGVRMVDGSGTVLKNGGRVMKNVTGYDLVKLMAGSYGTLGVLTEVAFKVLPAPPSTATLIYAGGDWATAQALLTTALGTPYEVSGAARLPAGSLADDGRILLRLEGFEESVGYRIKALTNRLDPVAGKPLQIIRDGEVSVDMWRNVRDVTALAKRAGDVWRISVRPSDVSLAAQVAKIEDVVLDWGGGLIWALVSEGTDVRAALGEFHGHASLIRASTATRRNLARFQPEAAPIAKLSAGLREKFDPRGILNRGLMG